ncbi:hypothetical protein GLAREA_00304 [Glarea lozoyensis ATCC 20868]|uniref:Uncharacterized protein n=2 Tax=Glarea lozoyensis TaxID=101852 RepID=S3DAY9_GLAL2|nr:uncharacterized protein GLAREA_00304 [Glarea lozoyensis ATCC 20868]EHL03404.1 hypothetical protein M7I_0627 [Glarea lozoyensis 74030]EPE29146.1 hypothetical protein GLAREA_00304 [Glarea lozoyensis ATCC 20868]
MDGDSTAKALDAGANSVVDITEMGSDAIHEKGHMRAPAGEKTTGTGTPALNKDGAIGSMFKKEGAIGSVGEKVGGPLASDGMIGKNFNPDGKVGGTIQQTLGKKGE